MKIFVIHANRIVSQQSLSHCCGVSYLAKREQQQKMECLLAFTFSMVIVDEAIG